MNDLEARILQYPDLSPERQRAVAAAVAGDPDLAALLEDVKALDRLAAPGDAAPGSAEALAERLRALDAENTPAAEHFEALTGHAPGTPPGTPPDGAPRPSVAEPAQAPPTGVANRPARRRSRLARGWQHAGRYVAAVLLAGAVVYGALFAASRLSQSPMERLAHLDGERLHVEGYGTDGLRTRSGGAADSSAAAARALDRRYLHALRRLRASRTATLGLFPRYDAAALDRAASDLQAVARKAEARSFLQLEALFFLGKARLAQGDRAGATRALRRVVAGGGRLAPEAQEILTTLYADAAYDGPPAGGDG